MSTLPKNVGVRFARRDDVPAILSWLNVTSFLSATRLSAFSEVQTAKARVTLQALVDQEMCLVAVLDNIRIAAIFNRGDTTPRVDVCPVWYIPRLQFGWISRMGEILDEARKITVGKWRSGRLDPAIAPLVSESPKQNDVQHSSYSLTGRRVLVLGPSERSQIPINALKRKGYEVHLGLHHDEITMHGPFDLVVCSGYHLRIPQTICDEFEGRIINIHAGCLPWARGIGLTLFSVLLDYPLGTSIHLIDSGLDTGDLLLENRMHVKPSETLRTLYSQMLDDVNSLFVRFLDLLVSGQATRIPQRPLNPRAYSRTRTEFENVLEICPNGYDTQLGDIKTLAKAMQCMLAFRNHLTTDPDIKVNQKGTASNPWRN